MDRWRGRVALVTGASAGIGAALCRELTRQGMVVVGCARNIQRIQVMAVEEATRGGTLLPLKCDLTKEEDILKMFEEIRLTVGRIDLCVNNAGLSFDCSLLSGDTAAWRTMLDVNVLALCVCMREAVKLMREKGIDDGQIMHLSSMSGHRIPEQTSYLYMATKVMVKALTEALRREMRGQNSRIRVTSISPGLVETEFEYRCFSDDPETARNIYTSIECLRPEDIVQCVLHILGRPQRVEVHDVLLRPTEQVV